MSQSNRPPLPAGHHDDLVRRLAAIDRADAEAAMTETDKAHQAVQQALRLITDRAIDNLKSTHHRPK